MSDDPKFCPDCGASLDPGAAFCGACGAKVASPAAANAPTKTPPPPKRESPTRAAPPPPPIRKARKRTGPPPPPPPPPIAGGAGNGAAPVDDIVTMPPAANGGSAAGVVVGNTILMALCWALAWGAGALLIFYDFLNPGLVIGEITQNGFTSYDLEFASNALVAGGIGGGVAGILMMIPFSGVFMLGFGRFLSVFAAWAAAVAFSRYAAIAFDFYLPEHIISYFAACGLAIGVVMGLSLIGRKPGAGLLSVLGAALIWCGCGALSRYMVLQFLGF